MVDGHVSDNFLTLLQPKTFDHASIYNEIVNFFTTNNIDYKKNMVGFASDGASVLQGCHNSVSALFKRDITRLFVMKCISHSLAICAAKATKEILEVLEKLLRHV